MTGISLMHKGGECLCVMAEKNYNDKFGIFLSDHEIFTLFVLELSQQMRSRIVRTVQRERDLESVIKFRNVVSKVKELADSLQGVVSCFTPSDEDQEMMSQIQGAAPKLYEKILKSEELFREKVLKLKEHQGKVMSLYRTMRKQYLSLDPMMGSITYASIVPFGLRAPLALSIMVPSPPVLSREVSGGVIPWRGGGGGAAMGSAGYSAQNALDFEAYNKSSYGSGRRDTPPPAGGALPRKQKSPPPEE